jgi:hypothetical protein
MDADTERDHETTFNPLPTNPLSAQLRLLDSSGTPDWRLDEATRERGRRGVELARAALRSARGRLRSTPDDGKSSTTEHAPNAA